MYKKTILLAEDEPNDVFLMQRSVRKMHASILLEAVKDGEEAIQYLSGEGQYADRDLFPMPDLIVLDIKMPRKTGFDVLEWLKQEGAFLHVPVVILTSSAVKSDIAKAHQLGADAYLVKPASFEELKHLFVATQDFLAVHAIC